MPSSDIYKCSWSVWESHTYVGPHGTQSRPDPKPVEMQIPCVVCQRERRKTERGRQHSDVEGKAN